MIKVIILRGTTIKMVYNCFSADCDACYLRFLCLTATDKITVDMDDYDANMHKINCRKISPIDCYYEHIEEALATKNRIFENNTKHLKPVRFSREFQ